MCFLFNTLGHILGDPGADSGGKGKTKRVKKNGEKERREGSLLFFAPFFFARLVFPLSPLSVPGSPRMPWTSTSIGVRWRGCNH